MKLKLETMIEFEDGAVPVADDYGYVAELINAIREKASRDLTVEEEYTFYKYVMDLLYEVEFIEGDD